MEGRGTVSGPTKGAPQGHRNIKMPKQVCRMHLNARVMSLLGGVEHCRVGFGAFCACLLVLNVCNHDSFKCF